MKKDIVLLVICCLTLSACGCVGNKSESVSQINHTDMIIEENIEIEETTPKTDEEDVVVAEELDVFPPEFAGEYLFTSGAGAWSTGIRLNADGTFSGNFSDSELGVSGEGYDSTVYRCDFTGKFKIVEKINEYSYYATLSDLKFDKKEDIIIDRVKFINSTPYGIEGGERFILYTPQTPINVLDEDFLWWMLPFKSRDDKTENLGFYAIYNIDAKTGFFYDELS